MKAKFTFFCLLLIFCSTLKAQYVTIPDANFVAWLQLKYPSCMNGNKMDTTCVYILNEDIVNVNYRSIYDLTGIRYFKSLKELNCSDNNLFNLSKLPAKLKALNCNYNGLFTLSKLPDSLDILSCLGNALTSLPSLPNTLDSINCCCNELTSLPTLPISLKFLGCGGNKLTNLPALPSSLKTLSCDENYITIIPTLPVSLNNLFCSNNKLSNLPVLPNVVKTIECHDNQLTVLPTLPDSLTTLYCQGNSLISLPALPQKLEDLACTNNNLTGLPVLPNKLKFLQCSFNPLTSLPSLPTSLTLLTCYEQKISCFPKFPDSLEVIQILNYFYNYFTCLPNYVQAMDVSLKSFPLCVSGDLVNNPNGCPSSTDVQESSLQTMCKVYPNQGTSNYFVELSQSVSIVSSTIEVYNLFGELQMSVKPTSSLTTIGLSAYSYGFYVVRINHGGVEFNQRIIKQ